MNCQQVVDKITEYLESALPESECRQWETHVAACRHCERYVAQMRMTIRLIGQLGPTRPWSANR